MIIYNLYHCLLFPAVEVLLKCLYHNGQCEHFCDGSGKSRKCFCANGYKLAADRQQCIKEGNNQTILQALLTITTKDIYKYICLTSVNKVKKSAITPMLIVK